MDQKSSKSIVGAGALLLAAFFWGFSFIFQRKAMDFMSPVAYTGLRFTLGGLLLLPYALHRLKTQMRASDRPRALLKNNLLWCLGAGSLLVVASALQQYGIVWTTVAKAGFITSLYVVLVPLVMLVLFKRKINLGEGIGVILATIGLFLLSITESLSLSLGDSLVLIGAFVWTFHVIYLGHFSPKMDSFVLGTGQALVCGGIGIVYILVRGEMPGLEALRAAWQVLVFGALMSVTLGFTLQVYGQKGASPAAAAIILQLEAVFAAICAWILLDEGMTARMILGAAIMLAGVLVSQLWPLFFGDKKGLEESVRRHDDEAGA